MKIINQLIHPKSNVEEMVCLITKNLKVKSTKSGIADKIHKHPNSSTLLAIHDVLLEYEVSSVALRCNGISKLQSIKGNFLVQIETVVTKQKLFAFVYMQNNNGLDWYNPKMHKREYINLEDFTKIFTGYILLFATSEASGDKEYIKHKHEECKQNIIETALFMFLPCVFIAIVGYNLIIFKKIDVTSFFYTLFLLTGCCIGGLLLIHEYNEYNPIIRNLCEHSKKNNCNAVLSSKASAVWGIPWSVIGCAYFFGIFSAMLISIFNTSVLTTSAFLHLLALPYIAYSLYFQKKVVKQWCPLCLAIQFIILALFITALAGGIYSHIEYITIKSLVCISVSLFLASTLVYSFWKYSMEIRKRNDSEEALKRIKYDPDIFKMLLHKEKHINISTDDYGIIIGNPKGNIHIIKVCNPYCSHCADAQPILQDLVTSNNNIKLQMIFTINPDYSHYKDYPIDIFLSLYHEGADMEAIFAEWYANIKKNIGVFGKDHPVKKHNTTWNNNNAKAMYNFCKEMKIAGTPTIFICGQQMPNIYSVSDLRYFY